MPSMYLLWRYVRRDGASRQVGELTVPDGGVAAWDDSLPFRRDDFVRVISSCLQGLGYK